MEQTVRPDKSKAKRVETEMFDGVVYAQPLIQSDEITMGAIFFQNGARTRPHTHGTDQVLTVVEGTCVVADERERRHLGVGEIVMVKKGQWHWHGAAKGTDACHISTRAPGSSTVLKDDLRDWTDW